MHKTLGPVLVFDSGVGGLSIVEKLRALMPDRSLNFVCDNEALPYGTKADDWLIERIVNVCELAVRRTNAQVLVLACNTASTLALDALRARLSLPIVGTVPAIKPAVALSQTKQIAVLATSATIRRPYLDDLIATYAQDCVVTRVAADPLVMQAEYKARGLPMDLNLLEVCLKPIFENPKIDTVIMGCTHFPLLNQYISKISPRSIAWIDSGEAIARRVLELAPEGIKRTTLECSLATAPETAGLAQALAHYGFAPPEPLFETGFTQ